MWIDLHGIKRQPFISIGELRGWSSVRNVVVHILCVTILSKHKKIISKLQRPFLRNILWWLSRKAAWNWQYGGWSWHHLLFRKLLRRVSGTLASLTLASYLVDTKNIRFILSSVCLIKYVFSIIFVEQKGLWVVSLTSSILITAKILSYCLNFIRLLCMNCVFVGIIHFTSIACYAPWSLIRDS